MVRWSDKIEQSANMYPTVTTEYKNDQATQFFSQV